MLFLDSSALVKRYVTEADSAAVRSAIRRDPYVAVAAITIAEIRAALAAAHRVGRIPNAVAYSRTTDQLKLDWPRYVSIDVDRTIAEHAGDLAERHALRGYDAVQLACGLVAAQSGRRRRAMHFGTFDLSLRHAAEAEGLPVLF
jgi:uncharacterized protein